MNQDSPEVSRPIPDPAADPRDRILPAPDQRLGLFLFLPLLLWLFQSSLTSPDSYVRYRAAFANPLVKLILIGLLWAFLHHLLAGLRFLALDLHYGTDLPCACDAAGPCWCGIALTAILGVWLW